jgi:Leucine-rich repeat (LRR) protein
MAANLGRIFICIISSLSPVLFELRKGSCLEKAHNSITTIYFVLIYCI